MGGAGSRGKGVEVSTKQAAELQTAYWRIYYLYDKANNPQNFSAQWGERLDLHSGATQTNTLTHRCLDTHIVQQLTTLTLSALYSRCPTILKLHWSPSEMRYLLAVEDHCSYTKASVCAYSYLLSWWPSRPLSERHPGKRPQQLPSP